MGEEGRLGELSLGEEAQGVVMERRSVEPLLDREIVFSPVTFPPASEPGFGSSLKYFVTVVPCFCDCHTHTQTEPRGTPLTFELH